MNLAVDFPAAFFCRDCFMPRLLPPAFSSAILIGSFFTALLPTLSCPKEPTAFYAMLVVFYLKSKQMFVHFFTINANFFGKSFAGYAFF